MPRTFIANRAKRKDEHSLFVTVTNQVDHKTIRTEVDDAGDEIIIVPTYTHPADIVMNGLLYPRDENKKAVNTFSGVPIPFGHPSDANGDFVSATSEIGTNRYQFGAFNGEASYDEESDRIYCEARINKRVANQSEIGREAIAAIESGQPICTSTGCYVEVDYLDKPMTNAEGDEYHGIVRDITFDHNAMLLNEAPAAGLETGTGMMINSYQLNFEDGKREIEDKLYNAVREEFNNGEYYAWLADFNDDEVIYELREDYYKIKYSVNDDGSISFIGETTKMRRKTVWEAIKNLLFAPSGKTSYNNNQCGQGGRVLNLINNKQGDDDMALRQKLIDKLKANKVELDYENVTEDQLLDAVDNLTATNSADNEQPDIAAIVSNALKPLQDKIDSLEANEKAKLDAEREEAINALKGDFEADELEAMPTSVLNKMVANKGQAYHIGGQFENNSQTDELSNELPE